MEPGHDAAQEFHPGQTGGALCPASGLLQFIVGQVEAGFVDLLAGMGQVGLEETLAGAPVDGIPVEDALGQPRGLFEGVAGEGEIQGLVEDFGVLRPTPQGLVHDGASLLEASRLTVMADEVQVARQIVRVQVQAGEQPLFDLVKPGALDPVELPAQAAMDQGQAQGIRAPRCRRLTLGAEGVDGIHP